MTVFIVIEGFFFQYYLKIVSLQIMWSVIQSFWANPTRYGIPCDIGGSYLSNNVYYI